MNPKYRTLDWWIIGIWFLIFGVLSALILFSPPIPPINYTIIIAGFFLMIYCASKETEWFPPKPEGEEKT